MGSRRRTGDSVRPHTNSPRSGSGGTAAIVGGACWRITSDSAVAGEAWLLLDSEINQLALQWARLETQMAREFGWLALSQVERRALPQAAEMFEIEERLDQLSDERENRLTSLAKLKAKDLHGVASKLAIAAQVLRHEGGPAHQLVADAVNALATRCCPDCGAPYVTGAERP
jgi:hypothetical protein